MQKKYFIKFPADNAHTNHLIGEVKHLLLFPVIVLYVLSTQNLSFRLKHLRMSIRHWVRVFPFFFYPQGNFAITPLKLCLDLLFTVSWLTSPLQHGNLKISIKLAVFIKLALENFSIWEGFCIWGWYGYSRGLCTLCLPMRIMKWFGNDAI